MPGSDNETQGSGRLKSVPGVTVVIVTSNLRRHFAAECIRRVKLYTTGLELVVLDNFGSSDFIHPREMNRIARSIETDFVVFMDDDVHVEPHWLTGLLSAVDDSTAAVTPVHRDRQGLVSYSGIYITSASRYGEHLIDLPGEAREIHAYCSALVLLDRRKTGSLVLDDRYRKYFFDHVHGLQIWEAGFKVMCTPEVVVTHLSGATMKRFSPAIEQLYTGDRDLFINDWIVGGRLAGLEEGIWKRYPHLTHMKELSEKIDSFDGGHFDGKNTGELDDLVPEAREYNLFRNMLLEKLKSTREAMISAAADQVRVIEKYIKELVTSVPSRGGAATPAAERFLIRRLVTLLGPAGYLSLRRRLGDYLRRKGRPRKQGDIPGSSGGL